MVVGVLQVPVNIFNFLVVPPTARVVYVNGGEGLGLAARACSHQRSHHPPPLAPSRRALERIPLVAEQHTGSHAASDPRSCSSKATVTRPF